MGKAGKAATGTKDGGPTSGAAKKVGNSAKDGQPQAVAAAKAKLKGEAAKAAQEGDAMQKGVLSSIRPKPRPLFLVAFVAYSVSIAGFYDPCNVKGKKRDCGYSGITPAACRSFACFTKGGGGVMKKHVKVSRADGDTLGISFTKETSGGLLVNDILDGAVTQHNSKLSSESEDVILPGDKITKVSGSSTVANMIKAIEATSGKTVEFEIQRSRLPSWLRWLESPKGKPNMLEKLLTSLGSVYFAKTWFFNAKLAFACWLISGYPLASLPMYAGLSAVTAVQLTRCCHDENVGGGVPHCFKPTREPMQNVLQKVLSQSKDFVANIQRDPRAYLDDILFLPGK